MKTPEKFKLLGELSKEGNFGKVYLYENLYLNRKEAVKIVQVKGNESGENQAEINEKLFESSVLEYLRKSAYIVDIYDAEFEGENFKIRMEYLENGSLSSYLKGNIFLSTSQSIKIAECILHGLEHAHNKGILHLDIKPGNILIQDENIYKLGDFGLSVKTDSNNFKEIYTWHRPPENLSGKSEKPTPQSDIYMFGVTMYRLLNGEEHFFRKLEELKSKKKLKKSIISGKFPDRNEYLPHVPKKLKKIVNDCLNINLSKRYESVREIRKDISKLKLNYLWEVKEKNESFFHFICKRSGLIFLELIAEKKGNLWNLGLKKVTKKSKIQVKKYCSKNITEKELDKKIAEIFNEYF